MNIVDLLDELAEFQSQADYLELEKRRLLDEVKIPVEVLAAQDEANKRRQALEAEIRLHQARASEQRNERLAEVVDPEMPPEFVAALEAARKKRAEIMSDYDAKNVTYQLLATDVRAKIDADLQVAVADVYTQVAARKVEISAEFDGKAVSVLDNIAKLTARIKNEVKAAGQTVKGKFFQAVYVKGRVTWNTDMLDGMVIAFPALAKARKEGDPSVTLRKVG